MSFAGNIYTSPTQGPADRLAEIVQKAIEQRVIEIIQIEAMKAATEVETKVRAEAAQIASRVVNRMHFERHANELIIRLEFNNGTKS